MAYVIIIGDLFDPVPPPLGGEGGGEGREGGGVGGERGIEPAMLSPWLHNHTGTSVQGSAE